MFGCDGDRLYYLRAMELALAKYHCQLHSYVLMTNHVHLLVTGRVEGAISSVIQDIGRKYVRFINRKGLRTGTLFEGRFRASPVQTERYFLTCMRYIELNPVRASMVARPDDYPWSSYAANRSGAPGAPLTAHATYLSLGNGPKERAHRYIELFGRPISDTDLTDIRESLRECRVLGTPEFQKQLSDRLGQPTAPAPHGGKRPGQGRPRKEIKGSDLELTP